MLQPCALLCRQPPVGRVAPSTTQHTAAPIGQAAACKCRQVIMDGSGSTNFPTLLACRSSVLLTAGDGIAIGSIRGKWALGSDSTAASRQQPWREQGWLGGGCASASHLPPPPGTGHATAGAGFRGTMVRSAYKHAAAPKRILRRFMPCCLLLPWGHPPLLPPAPPAASAAPAAASAAPPAA